jgi:hypothetical protein
MSAKEAEKLGYMLKHIIIDVEWPIIMSLAVYRGNKKQGQTVASGMFRCADV